MGMRWRARRIAGPAAALALAAGIVGFAGSPASAHASLVATSPAHGAELDGPPEEIRLRFTERVTVPPGGVALRDARGAVVATEPASAAASDPRTVVLPVPPGLADGGYVVSFRVVSADSHPVAGAFAFGVGAAAASLDGADLAAGSRAVSVVFAAARWVSYAGLALLAGGLAVFALCWPGGWANRRARLVACAGWLASMVGAVSVLLLQGPYAAGRSLVDVIDPVLLLATLGTEYGGYVLARLGLVLLAGALVIGGVRLMPRLRDAGAIALGVALAATWVGTGHANASDNPLDAVAEVAHVAAMTTWFGGLALLAVCLLPRSSAATFGPGELGRVLRRFSAVATGAVATLAGTGVYVAWRRVGTLDALVGTTYGRLLAFKLAAIGVLLWLGAVSLSVVRRRYRRATSEPPAVLEPTRVGRSKRRAARSALEQERAARAQLSQSVRVEVGLAAAILAVASLLVATPPGVVAATAAEAAANTATGPVLEEAPLDDGAVRVLVDPAWVGDNRVVVEVVDLAGEPWDVPEVRASFVPPEDDGGPLPVELTRAGPGLYRGTDTPLPFAADWRLQVTVRTSEIDSTTVQVDVPVR